MKAQIMVNGNFYFELEYLWNHIYCYSMVRQKIWLFITCTNKLLLYNCQGFLQILTHELIYSVLLISITEWRHSCFQEWLHPAYTDSPHCQPGQQTKCRAGVWGDSQCRVWDQGGIRESWQRFQIPDRCPGQY